VAPALTVQCLSWKKLCLVNAKNKKYKVKKSKFILGLNLIPFCDPATSKCVMYATLICDFANFAKAKKAGLKGKGKPKKWLCKNQYGKAGADPSPPPLSKKYVTVKDISCGGCTHLKGVRCPEPTATSGVAGATTVAGGGSSVAGASTTDTSTVAPAPTTVAG